jgi:hypothetical protein
MSVFTASARRRKSSESGQTRGSATETAIHMDSMLFPIPSLV